MPDTAGEPPLPVERPARPAGTDLPALLAALAAIGRSMPEEFDPQGFLAQFSDHLQPLLPHHRLVIVSLDEDGRTFTVLAEHAADGPTVHTEHYTVAFDPQARYLVAKWTIRPVFEGEAMVIGNFATDPRFVQLNPHERAVFETGVRAGLLVPLHTGGRLIGALSATS